MRMRRGGSLAAPLPPDASLAPPPFPAAHPQALAGPLERSLLARVEGLCDGLDRRFVDPATVVAKALAGAAERTKAARF